MRTDLLIRNLCIGVLSLSIFSVALPAAAPGFQCGESDTTNWKGENTAPHTGDTKAFVLLIKFKNDNADHNDCYAAGWPDSLDHALPAWADSNNLLHPDTTSANFVQGSLTDFWDTMSVGNYCFYGDVYDAVYEPAYQYGHYANTYGGNAVRASGYVIWEALLEVDDVVDYSQYDTNPRDGVVDAIQIVYRYWPSLGEGFATLGVIYDPDSVASWPIVTDDTVPVWDPETEDYDTVAVEINAYSGTTQIVINRPGSLAVMTHEWGHRLGFGELGVGAWGMMSPSAAGTAMCAFERWWLGWLSPREFEMTADSLGVLLSHSIPTGDVLKILADTVSVLDSCRSFYLYRTRFPGHKGDLIMRPPG